MSLKSKGRSLGEGNLPNMASADGYLWTILVGRRQKLASFVIRKGS